MIHFLKGFNIFSREGKYILDLNQYFIADIEERVKDGNFKFDEDFIKNIKTKLDILVKENVILKSKDKKDLRTLLLQSIQQFSLEKLKDYFVKKMNDDDYLKYFDIQKKTKLDSKTIICNNVIPKEKKYIVEIKITDNLIIKCDVRSNFTIIHSIKKFMLEYFSSNAHFEEFAVINPRWNESNFESPIFLFKESINNFQKLKVLVVIKIVFETAINKLVAQKNNLELKDLDYGFIKSLIDLSESETFLHPLFLKQHLDEVYEDEIINGAPKEIINDIQKTYKVTKGDNYKIVQILKENFDKISDDYPLLNNLICRANFKFYTLIRLLCTREYLVAISDKILSKLYKSINIDMLIKGDVEIPRNFVETLQTIIETNKISDESIKILRQVFDNKKLPTILQNVLELILIDSIQSKEVALRNLEEIYKYVIFLLKELDNSEIAVYRTYNIELEILELFNCNEISDSISQNSIKIFLEDFKEKFFCLNHVEIIPLGPDQKFISRENLEIPPNSRIDLNGTNYNIDIPLNQCSSYPK